MGTSVFMLSCGMVLLCMAGMCACISQARALHQGLCEEAKEKILPYTGEGCRLILPGPDSREAVAITGDGAAKKIVMEKSLRYYLTCDVPPEGISIQGSDLGRHIIKPER